MSFGHRDKDKNKKRKRSPTPRPTKVHVGRLTRNVNKDHIQEIFALYGAIKYIDMPNDRIHPNTSRGHAYVEYENPDDAEKAIKYMDGGGLIVKKMFQWFQYSLHLQWVTLVSRDNLFCSYMSRIMHLPGHPRQKVSVQIKTQKNKTARQVIILLSALFF